MTTYSTADYAKSMTNLVSNPSFEGTGWSGGSYDTTHAKFGTYGYKMTGNTSSWEVLANNSSSISMTNTHIYYVRWYVYHEGAAGTTGCYFGIAEPNFIEGVSLGPANQWNMISAVNNRSSFSSGSQGFRLDYNNSRNATSVWFDGVMLIDLTATFGSGKEPTKEWMDANIPFFTDTYTVKDIRLTFYDSGVTSYATGLSGSTIDLPIGSNGTGKFVGWWDGSGTYASTYTAYADTTLIARYDLVGEKLTVDSVSLQPNPVEVSATVLLAVTAVMVESSVPRWAGVTFTASDGLPMSSPYQVGIWDTSEGDPMAVFAGKGIKSSGRDVPPLQAQTVPLPRCGIWSSGISDAYGNISFSITGTVTGGPYTSAIVMLSESTVNITRATISYNGGTAVAGQCIGSKVVFPKGTYSTFTITITGLSMPYEHAHILNIAPGGSE